MITLTEWKALDYATKRNLIMKAWRKGGTNGARLYWHDKNRDKQWDWRRGDVAAMRDGASVTYYETLLALAQDLGIVEYVDPATGYQEHEV